MNKQKNTVGWFGLNPYVYDNSKRVDEYNRFDTVMVIDTSNYYEARQTPFKAVIDKIHDNTVMVQCLDSEDSYELYDYQIADEVV